MMGKGTRPVRAKFWADGIPIRGQVESSGNGLLMEGIPQQNNPELVQVHENALRTATESGGSPKLGFTFTERFSTLHADLSWIRSAYLAAFAALGWRYVLHPALNPIRAQLNTDSPEALPDIMGFNPAADRSARSLMIVREPENLSSVHVTIGHYAIFLPDPWGTLSLEELAHEIAELREESGMVSATLTGQTTPWPTKPLYILDKAIA